MNKKTFFNLLSHSFFPNRCVGCNTIQPPSVLFCEPCEESIKRITQNRCKKCFNIPKSCNCQSSPKWFARTAAPFEYTTSIRQALIDLKSYKNKELISFFAKEMANTIQSTFKNETFDCVIPVPSHKSRLKERGYNQSGMLAKEIANSLNLPYCDNVLTQPKKSKGQHNLEFKLRKENVKGIYQAYNLNYDYVNILLVDDIITTGFTLSECAKMLRLEGAKNVYCICVAKN